MSTNILLNRSNSIERRQTKSESVSIRDAIGNITIKPRISERHFQRFSKGEINIKNLSCPSYSPEPISPYYHFFRFMAHCLPEETSRTSNKSNAIFVKSCKSEIMNCSCRPLN